MRNRLFPIFLASMIFIVGNVGGCGCDTELNEVLPNMRVSPLEVNISPAPVSDLTLIVVDIANTSAVPLFVDDIVLTDGSDPSFEIQSVPPIDTDTARREDFPRVGPGETESVVIGVRPRVIAEIKATLRITAEPRALVDGQEGQTVEVEMIVDAQDLGLPDIEVEPTVIDFGRVGQGDVVREDIVIRNVGVRDLILDETTLVAASSGDETIKLSLPLGAGAIVAPGSSVSTQVVFAPFDVEDHAATLEIRSNDPDENPVEVSITGSGTECPIAVAELLEDPDDIEPLDTLRLDGRGSYPVTPDTTLVTYEWTLEQRPVGSTTTLSTPGSDRTEITADIAGTYRVRLNVEDSAQVRSCNNAEISFFAVPTEDLHIQLVWDHPTADFDLHLAFEDEEVFTALDTYYNNNAIVFEDIPDSNPTLDKDDNSGYGPENVNIKTPEPGSRWRAYVHYWNAQTDGDPLATATIRLYARGQQVIELTQAFEEDEHLWSAFEIVWPFDPAELPAITPLGLMEPYERNF